MFGRKKNPSFYEAEVQRIQEMAMKLEPGSTEYDNLMKELKTLQDFAGKQKEMKQMFTKEGRGNIVGKIVGFLGLGGLAFGLSRFEKNGHFFSGTSAESIKGIVRLGTRFLG